MLIDQLTADLTTARRAKDRNAMALLSTLLSDVIKVGKDAPLRGEKEPRPTTDLEAIAVIKSFLKRAEETLGHAQGSPAMAAHIERVEAEIAMLKHYLPEQLSETDIAAVIETVIASDGLARTKASIGPLMTHLRTNYGGRYDSKLANQIVQQKLAGAP